MVGGGEGLQHLASEEEEEHRELQTRSHSDVLPVGLELVLGEGLAGEDFVGVLGDGERGSARVADGVDEGNPLGGGDSEDLAEGVDADRGGGVESGGLHSLSFGAVLGEDDHVLDHVEGPATVLAEEPSPYVARPVGLVGAGVVEDRVVDEEAGVFANGAGTVAAAEFVEDASAERGVEHGEVGFVLEEAEAFFHAQGGAFVEALEGFEAEDFLGAEGEEALPDVELRVHEGELFDFGEESFASGGVVVDEGGGDCAGGLGAEHGLLHGLDVGEFLESLGEGSGADAREDGEAGLGEVADGAHAVEAEGAASVEDEEDVGEGGDVGVA